MPTASEKANLARIRDNQRRSRARRKEYLAELEAKLRQCELQGIEASSEIQLAARRVADENRKLRALLAQNGVADSSVDAYVRDEGLNNSTATSDAVQALEQLLNTRRECCVSGSPPRGDNGSNSRQYRDSSRCSSVNTAQATWEFYDHRVSPRNQVFSSPTSSASRPNSVGSSSHMQQAQTMLVQMPNRIANSSMSTSTLDFDPQYAVHSVYNQQRASTPYSNRDAPISNVNSCVYATDMILTMAGGDPTAVRADLGCLSGMDCEVDNQRVFSVMDRYNVGL